MVVEKVENFQNFVRNSTFRHHTSSTAKISVRLACD